MVDAVCVDDRSDEVESDDVAETVAEFVSSLLLEIDLDDEIVTVGEMRRVSDELGSSVSVSENVGDAVCEEFRLADRVGVGDSISELLDEESAVDDIVELSVELAGALDEGE